MRATVEVFTSPTCPHCPSAKKLAHEVAKEMDDVVVKEMSTATHEGSRKAKRYGIMSVPTIIITGPASPEPIGLRGTPPKKGLIKAINISLGKDKWKEKKKGFFSRLFGGNEEDD